MSPSKWSIVRQRGFQLGTVALALGSHPLRAQKVVSVEEAPACTACRIELTRVVTIGQFADSQLLTPGIKVARTRHGSYAVVNGTARGTVLFYSAEGMPQRAVDLRRGGSISEGFLSAIDDAPGGGVTVFGGMKTVIGPSFHVESRTLLPPFMHVHKAFVLPDSSTLVQATYSTEAGAGFLAHLMGPQLTPIKSFAAPEGIWRTDRPWATRGPIAIDRRGGFWTAQMNRYRLDRWLGPASHIQTVRRAPPWFQPWDSTNTDIRRYRPAPHLVALWQDSLSRMWTMVSLPSLFWKERRTGTSDNSAPIPLAVLDSTFDTMIEVIDVERGVVVHRQRFRGSYQGFLSDGAIWKFRESRTRELVIDVWAAALRRN
jgi:hypothetical protein